MSGFAGLFDCGQRFPERADIVAAMMQAMSHRLPPQVSQWTDVRGGLVLGHGMTPATVTCAQSQDERWVAVMDGEIHNQTDLLNRLSLTPQSSPSPLATLLDAVSRWGVQIALDRADGVFAIAIWDRLERTIHLARDRFGEKPLYWMRDGETLAFASEIRALRTMPGFDARLDGQALDAFMRLGWYPAPLTPYASVRRLPPGAVLTFKRGGAEFHPFWRGVDRAIQRVDGFHGGDAAAAERLNQLLRAAVSVRTRDDVVQGVFLSGGVDDLALAAVLRNMTAGPLHSFALNFAASPAPGGHMARTVADYLGARHLDVTLSDQDCAASLQRMAAHQDHPNGTGAMVRDYLLCQAASSMCGVVHESLGASELFGGHHRYAQLPHDWNGRSSLPGWWRRACMGASHLLPGLSSWRKSIARQGADSLLELLVMDHGHWLDVGSPLQSPHPFHLPAALIDPHLSRLPPSAALMVADGLCWLPDGLNAAADQASMCHGMPMHLPFLDRAVVDFAWSLPQGMSSLAQESLRPLFDVLARYVPPELTQLDSRPLDMPLGRWLRGPLRDWAADLLLSDRLRRQGLLKPATIARCWQSILSGDDRWQREIWHVLMWQSWLEQQPE